MEDDESNIVQEAEELLSEVEQQEARLNELRNLIEKNSGERLMYAKELERLLKSMSE